MAAGAHPSSPCTRMFSGARRRTSMPVLSVTKVIDGDYTRDAGGRAKAWFSIDVNTLRLSQPVGCLCKKRD